MCGLAGILTCRQRSVEPDRLDRMLHAIKHRGPDGHGTLSLGRCHLLHARLAVLDPAHGRQPMVYPDRQHADIALVFNGEIYNHRELRRELEAFGHRFSSDHCDSEVVLHGYRQWGVDLPRRLRGMFAWAVWDESAQTLLLGRDRAGKKPLYYQVQPDGEFLFASLPSAILQARRLGDAPSSVDPQALGDYLRFGYVFSDHLIQGIKEVPVGCRLSWNAVTGACDIQPYWSPPELSGISSTGPDDAAIEQSLSFAVGCRLEADVPLGCFLSGGIDSSLIASLANEQLKKIGAAPLKTFAVAMPQADYDESLWARRVADQIASEHRVIHIDPRRSVRLDLLQLIESSGEPTADSSILPTFWLSQAVREHVTVALSGDGGDELFGGYERYRAMSLLRRHGWWARWVPAPLADRLAGQAKLNPKSRQAKLIRFLRAAGQPSAESRYADMIQLFTPEQIAALTGLSESEVRLGGGGLPDWPPEFCEDEPARAAMRWDFAHYLPFDLLRKVDRASMAVALEVRCPMLAVRLVAMAMSLPSRQLMPGGQLKGLLRRLAARRLPAEIVQRPKQGFALPIGQWFRGHLKDQLLADLSESPWGKLNLNNRQIMQLAHEHTIGQADHTHRLFALWSLGLWARLWI